MLTDSVVRLDEGLALDDLAGDWSRLATATGAGPFQSFEWAAAWWAVYGPGLQLLPALVWQGTALVGIVPLAVRPTGGGEDEVVFVGTGPSDHLDWLLDDATDPGRVLQGLLQQLERAGLPRVDLSDIPERSRLAGALRSADLGPDISVEASHVCPVVGLPGDARLYFSSRSRNLREMIRRSRVHAGRLGVGPLIAHRSFAACRDVMQPFICTHLAWWEDRAQVSVLTQPRFREFLERAVPAMAGVGLAEVSCRYRDDELVSAFVLLGHGSVRYYYQSALSPAFASMGPGVGHMALELGRAIDEGIQTFDLLRGEEPYKSRWATGTAVTWRASGTLR